MHRGWSGQQMEGPGMVRMKGGGWIVTTEGGHEKAQWSDMLEPADML